LPSRKKGRFSGRDISKRDRFTCSRSASIVAKSGFTVAFMVTVGSGEKRGSAPVSQSVSCPSAVRDIP
jgi:hypothetical protein